MRRLLIPGLLVGLLVVVLVAALFGRADGADGDPVEAAKVSRIGDARVVESSGLAVSARHDDLAYTINDSGNAALVFAVRISTGEVVGVTTLQTAVPVLDSEALALRDGTLWVADTGDNGRRRTDVALYALDEPGPGDRAVTPKRYPITYEAGPQDVEAVAVPPDSGRVLLLSKLPAGGVVHRLPKTLREGRPNTATPTSDVTPAFATDATMTDDGGHVLVRNYFFAQLRAADSWELVRTDGLPNQPQGETIALEPGDRSYLVGSEGARSQLWRVPFDPKAPEAEASPSASSSTPPEQETVSGEGTQVPWVVVVAAGAVVVVVIGIMLSRRRSRES